MDSIGERMNYDDLTEEQQEIWDKAHDEGYDKGWNDYAENSATEDYDEGFQEGLAEGAKLEQARIQSVLQMMFDAALNMGQGNKAVQYRHAMELLTPINYQYNEAKYYEDLRNDGF